MIAVKVDTFRLLANSAGETVVLHPAGDLDLHTADAIERWATGYLDGTPAAVTLIDLSDVGFMDSAGLGALIGAWKRITATGRTVMVAAPTPQPARLMRITGLEGRLGVRATVAEALEEIIPRRTHAPA
ncbi:STAS domain-containing protein [Nonomuraea sp. NPDC049655]|uniref:STAS domain-containing protein n=1 Tax=Nonomuraea sp. NPDC049655 TaxID=3364355 RepID=UPI0037A68680